MSRTDSTFVVWDHGRREALSLHRDRDVAVIQLQVDEAAIACGKARPGAGPLSVRLWTYGTLHYPQKGTE